MSSSEFGYYFGKRGVGKSAYGVKVAKKEIKKIKKGKSKYKAVLCNFKIDGAYYTNFRELLQKGFPTDCLIIVDEAGIAYNNRLMKMFEQEIEFWKLSRHYNCGDILIFSQSHSDSDITLRRLADRLYLIKRLPFDLSLIKPINQLDGIDKETHQMIEGYKYAFFTKWRIFNTRFYWHAYDSFERSTKVPTIYDLDECKYVEKIPDGIGYLRAEFYRQKDKAKAFIGKFYKPFRNDPKVLDELKETFLDEKVYKDEPSELDQIAIQMAMSQNKLS